KIDVVDGKVDSLRDMVLPLVQSSKHTAENTERIANSMEKFTDEQRKTNDNIYKKLNNHDVSLTELGVKQKGKSDVMTANAKILVAVITTIGVIVGGILGLAPLLF